MFCLCRTLFSCFYIILFIGYLYIFCWKIPPPPFSERCGRSDWLVELEELFNFQAPAFPEVRSALAANRDLIDGPSPVSVLSLLLLRPGVCCKIGL